MALASVGAPEEQDSGAESPEMSHDEYTRRARQADRAIEKLPRHLRALKPYLSIRYDHTKCDFVSEIAFGLDSHDLDCVS